MTFFDEAYVIEIVGWEEGVFGYRFESEGEHTITKDVSISAIGGIENAYNLGFGNREFREDGTTFSNDKSTRNNNDFDKVLKTVFSCVAHYLQKVNPTARIFFYGNAEHKHRVYRGKIGKYIFDLSNYFIVEGGALSETAPHVEQKEEVMKNGKKRERIIRVKDEGRLNEIVKDAVLEFIEPFSKDNIESYQFISIRLK